MDGKFRAPQFSFRREPQERPSGDAVSTLELRQLFGPTSEEQASTPTVVVKRRRLVPAVPKAAEHPGAASATDEPATDASDAGSRQRVFLVKPRDAERAALPSCETTSIPVADGDDRDASAPSPKQRRRRVAKRVVPDSMRPGDVVVLRPEPSARPLSRLEDELEQASHLLESLASGPRSWELDLGIKARWAVLETALDKLKSTAVPPASALAVGNRK